MLAELYCFISNSKRIQSVTIGIGKWSVNYVAPCLACCSTINCMQHSAAQPEHQWQPATAIDKIFLSVIGLFGWICIVCKSNCVLLQLFYSFAFPVDFRFTVFAFVALLLWNLRNYFAVASCPFYCCTQQRSYVKRFVFHCNFVWCSFCCWYTFYCIALFWFYITRFSALRFALICFLYIKIHLFIFVAFVDCLTRSFVHFDPVDMLA